MKGYLDWSHLSKELFLTRVIVEKIRGRIEVTGRLRKGRKQLLDELNETGGYCKLREEALDRPVWRTGF
jgi:hypothetical protein